MPTIVDMAKADSWAVLLLGKSGCTPDTWTAKQLGEQPRTPSWSECHTWYRWAVGVARKLKPTVALITGAYGRGPGSDNLVTGMVAAAKNSKAYAKVAILIGDTPRMNKDPIDCLLHSGNTMKDCAATYPQTMWKTDDKIAAKAKALSHTGFLSSRGWFCYQSVCPMVVGRTIVYRDTGHISSTYAHRLDLPFRTAAERMILNLLTS